MTEIIKTYDHEAVEKELYAKWEKAGYFKPEVNPDGEPYTIIMPPPNANGSLHVGHAVFVTLEDIMIRYARLQGKAALWLPGADHAGFETQTVFEKKLEKEGRSRFNLPREQLYDETLKFTLENKKVMEDQLRRLGASCDWSREKFTLDPDVVKIVYETFVKLYEDGLAYRDVRPVNWCTKHQTSLSELEVKYEEQVDPLYFVKYKVESRKSKVESHIVVATVRPETMFGDKAIAVNPNDKRFAELIGLKAQIPLTDIEIPIIADEMVDPKFGTGVVKITPAHDPNDFEVAKRHDLEIREVIDQYGRMNEKAGPFAGMKIKEAREKVVEAMEQKGSLEKVEANYTHSVGKCYKCGTIIEPRILPQWFIAVNKKGTKSRKTLAKDAIDAVRQDKVNFVTPKFEKIFNHWMKNIRDWNISRQIVWGIRLPVWYKNIPTLDELPNLIEKCEEVSVGAEGSPVKEKTGEEYRFVANEIDIKWFHKNVTDQCNYSYVDFFEGKTRTRVNENAYTKTEKSAPRQGVVEKKGIVGRFGGEKVCLEERAIAGYARYEIEFKNDLPDAFSGRKTIKSTDILQNIQDGKSDQSVMVRQSSPLFDGWEQDTDVFDTWFSSGQWPFATLKTTQKRMGFAGDVVAQVLDNKTRTYRLRDHNFKVGDEVLFEDSLNSKVFGTGMIMESIETTVGKVDLKDQKHWKTYDKVEELISAFQLHYPDKQIDLKTPVWIYTYKFQSQTRNLELGTSDFSKFYPTDVMETGWDILFFWVARMIMLGLYVTGDVPFKNVYLHGLVRDKDRVKMSKSRGNVINPLGVADIYGADALRMALVFGTSAGNDAIISEEKIRGMRNFSNKIWNASRFVILRVTDGDLKTGQTGPDKINDLKIDEAKLTAADKKIIKNHTEIIKSVTTKLNKYQFSQAGEELYEYFWHNVCDVYIEESKAQLDDAKIQENTKKVLIKVLSESLILLHPFVPFVTEAVWQELQQICHELPESVMITKWPEK